MTALLGVPLLTSGAAALAGFPLPRMPPEGFVTIRGGPLQELAVEYPIFGADREFQFQLRVCVYPFGIELSGTR